MPTGSKDPFGLRRAANGIVKILAESGIPLPIRALFDFAIKKDLTAYYGTESKIKSPEELSSVLNGFMAERLSFYLKDVRGFAYDVVAAVLAAGADDVRDAIARAEALTAVRGSDDFVAISAAFKRIKNILRQAAEKNEPHTTDFTSSLVEPEELHLAESSAILTEKVAILRKDRNYAAALESIATLRPAVDAFFDKVMVMAPDPQLRAARLGLIQSVLNGFSGIADFSEIVTG